MFRVFRSAIRAADQFVASSTNRLKKPLENLIVNVERNVSTAAHRTGSLSSSFSPHLHAHGVHTSARAQPIGSSFSFPTRIALGRPLSAPKLPRAPTVPRSISEVGLGTARNFSSTRHVFQNIVDNVPIHTRALWEAEWDLKQRKAAERKLIKRETKKKQAERVPDKLEAKENVKSPLSPTLSAVSEDSVDSVEFSAYFAAPTTPALVKGVTTYLTVPLYPPQSHRAPLPASHTVDSLFPLSDLRDLHVTHSQHATRVTSLFIRLDGADVWSKGATCECYGGDISGMVTSLIVVFKGWDQAMVRKAIGDAGRGWCEMVEEREVLPASTEFLQQVQHPVFAAATPVHEATAPSLPDELDVTSSFILPTLDFSSNFASHMSHTSTSSEERSISPMTTRPASPLFMSPTHTAVHIDVDDGWSSGGEEYDRLSDVSIAATPVHRSLGFSVDFLERSHSGYGNDAFQSF